MLLEHKTCFYIFDRIVFFSTAVGLNFDMRMVSTRIRTQLPFKIIQQRLKLNRY